VLRASLSGEPVFHVSAVCSRGAWVG
jgi:hypothetical protein